jgi:predicted RecA/RadA family phage recombinase
MATNFVKPGENLTVTANAEVESGELVVIGNLAGVALNNAANGAEVVIATTGVFTLTKTSALEINVGDFVYAAATAGDVNKTPTSRVQIGIAVSNAPNPSPTVRVAVGMNKPVIA